MGWDVLDEEGVRGYRENPPGAPASQQEGSRRAPGKTRSPGVSSPRPPPCQTSCPETQVAEPTLGALNSGHVGGLHDWPHRPGQVLFVLQRIPTSSHCGLARLGTKAF